MQTRIDQAKRRPTAQYQFDSLYEASQWIARTPRKWRTDSSESNDYGHDWDLGVSFDDAIRMTREGWVEGAQRAQEALRAFPTRTPEPDTRTDVYGFRPHVPRFCAGAPDSMIRHAPKAETGNGRVLTLIIPLFVSAGVSARNVTNFGLAVAQYCNQLELDGTRLEIIGCFTQTNEGRDRVKWRTSYAITLKHADQPLDLAVIAFALGHPAMFRRIGFALMERGDAPCDNGAYGYPTTPHADDVINAPPGAFVLDGLNDIFTNTNATPESALEHVTSQIQSAIEAQELA